MAANDTWEDVQPGAAPADAWEDVAPAGSAPAPGAAAPADPKTSAAEAFGRGAAQGASLGFADEVAGLGKALFNTALEPRSGDFFGQKYRKGRDEWRAADAQAKEDHGGWYTAGNVAGTTATSLVPGLGAARGAGALKTAMAAGKIGALQGLGESEATDVKGLARDASVTGATSAVTAGMLSKFLSGAPGRVEKRLAAAQAEIDAVKGKPSLQMPLPGFPQERVFEKAAGKAAEEAPKGGILRDMADAGLAMVSPPAFLGKAAVKKVAWPALKSAGRIGDAGLATLVQMADNGSKPAQIVERGIKLGLSPTVAGAIAKWATRKDEDEATGP